MAALTNTELSATVDEVWDVDVLQARYAEATFMPRVTSKSDVVKRSGDIIHISIHKKAVVGTVSATGAFTPDAQTLTQVDMPVTSWKYVSNETLDQTEAQSFYSPESDFPKRAGAALAEQYDTELGLEHSNITTNIIGDPANPGPFDDTAMLAAFLKLANLNIPKNNLSFMLPPIAFYGGLFKLDRFTDADKAGLPKNVLTSNFRFPLLGVPAYENNLLATSGTAIKAWLLHKEAVAIGMQINNDFKRAERTAGLVLSTVVVMQSLYGIKTVRENHACIINVKNS